MLFKSFIVVIIYFIWFKFVCSKIFNLSAYRLKRLKLIKNNNNYYYF